VTPAPRDRDTIDAVAAQLGLTVRKQFGNGMFGAALVVGDSGEELILKAQPDVSLEVTWRTGAATADLMRGRGYPSPHYVDVGATETAVWSLQERLRGSDTGRLTVGQARKLTALARSHDFDSGSRRPWREEAVAACQAWLTGSALVENDRLAAIIERGADAEMFETTVVHGDFHHRNVLVDGDTVTGVFDWEIAGPGDWRFDLAMLLFACLMYPAFSEPSATIVVADALRDAAPDDVSSFLLACQVLRMLSLTAAFQPDKVDAFGAQMMNALDAWLR